MFLKMKQRELLQLICKGSAPEGAEFVPLTVNQVMERLTYHPIKQSVQTSVRSLEANDMVVRDYRKQTDGYNRVVYIPTEKGRSVAGNLTRPQPSFLEDEEDMDLKELLGL